MVYTKKSGLLPIMTLMSFLSFSSEVSAVSLSSRAAPSANGCAAMTPTDPMRDVSECTAAAPGGVCNVKCNAGYVGTPSQFQCVQTGAKYQWSGSKPQCSGNNGGGNGQFCVISNNLMLNTGVVSSTCANGKLDISQQCMVQCDAANGYTVDTGSPVVSCDAGGQIVQPSLTCKKIDTTPVDCVGDWTEYGPCTGTCGTGVMTSTYVISQYNNEFGIPCNIADGTVQTESCPLEPCPVDCVGETVTLPCDVSCLSNTVYKVAIPAVGTGKPCDYSDNTILSSAPCAASGDCPACTSTCPVGTYQNNVCSLTIPIDCVECVKPPNAATVSCTNGDISSATILTCESGYSLNNGQCVACTGTCSDYYLQELTADGCCVDKPVQTQSMWAEDRLNEFWDTQNPLYDNVDPLADVTVVRDGAAYYKGWCFASNNVDKTPPRTAKIQYTPFFNMTDLYTQNYTMTDVKSLYAVVRYPVGATGNYKALPYFVAYAPTNTYPFVRRTFYASTTPSSFSDQTFIFYYGAFPTSQYLDFPQANRIALKVINTAPAWPMAVDTDTVAAFQLHTDTAATLSGPFCVQDAGVAVAAAAGNALPTRSMSRTTELLLNPTVAKPVVVV